MSDETNNFDELVIARKLFEKYKSDYLKLDATTDEAYKQLELMQKQLTRIEKLERKDVLKPKKEFIQSSGPEKITPEQQEILISKLKNPKLLESVIDEIHKTGIVCEDNAIVSSVCKTMLRLINDHKPESSNAIFASKSSSGKDWIMERVVKTLVPMKDLWLLYSPSNQYVKYATQSILKTNPDFTWNGKVLFISEITPELLESEVFLVQTSKRDGKSGTVIDGKSIELNMPGKPVIFITGSQSILKEDFVRRLDIIDCDISVEQTQRVVRRVPIADKPDADLIQAIQYQLKPYLVIVPFEQELRHCIAKQILPLNARTNVTKLIDFIKAFAILFQYQRETDDNGKLIATYDDYENARKVFDILGLSGNLTGVSPKERLVLDTLITNNGELTDLQIRAKSGTGKYCYEILDNLERKGFIHPVELVHPDNKFKTDRGHALSEKHKGIFLPNIIKKNGKPVFTFDGVDDDDDDDGQQTLGGD